MKRHKKIEDQVLKELDEKMHVDLNYQDIIKDVDLSKYSSCEKSKKRIGFLLGGAGALAFCSVLIVAGIVISQNALDSNNKANENLTTPQVPHVGSSGINQDNVKTGLEQEFQNLSFNHEGEKSLDLNMYEVFYDTNGNLRQDKVSIYELQVSLKDTIVVAVYLEEDGIKEVYNNYQNDFTLSAQNIIDGSLLECFYRNECYLKFETRWIEVDVEKPIALYNGNLRLAGLYVFDNVNIKKEVLTSQSINKSYDYYRNVSLDVNDATNNYFTNVLYEKNQENIWCTALGTVNFNVNYFNNLTSKINYHSPLATINDNLITVESVENFDFEAMAEKCLKSSEDKYNTYDYDEYCLCLQEYYAKKGK